MSINLSNGQRVHFIGVGGIGISAIARLFLQQGKAVSGSDLAVSSLVLTELKSAGAVIYQAHRAKQVPLTSDLVIYSLAISENNPEYRQAKKLGIPLLSYPQMLGLISRNKFTIAISGTHGKTTTTAMIGEILRRAKYDPTVIVGGLMADRRSRHRTNLLVAESK